MAGFRQEGRVFIYLAEQVNSDLNKTEQVTQQEPEQPEQSGAGHNDVIVELQKAELTRLLRDNERLNSRIDNLIEMQQREQILRQQMQGQLDQLMERLALPAPVPPAPPEQEELKDRLQATETKFNLLTRAVGQLVAFLERRRQ